jgi:hypothetical protein
MDKTNKKLGKKRKTVQDREECREISSEKERNEAGQKQTA